MIDFGDGASSELLAQSDALHASVRQPLADGIGELQELVADHIKRYAFHERLEFCWVRSDD